MGIADPAAVLLVAQDPKTGDLYACDEFYKTDQVITQVGDAIEKMIKDIPPGMLHTPLIDPSANKRNKINRKTYKQQMQLEHNIIFKDANNRIEDGIAKTRDMFFRHKLWIFRDLTNTIAEGCEYRYPTLEERNNNRNIGDTPIDKNNHLNKTFNEIAQNVIDMTRYEAQLVKNNRCSGGYKI